MKGADEDLFVAIIADRFPGRVDAARQRRLRDDAAAPDGVQNFILADDSIVVPDQKGEKIEDLGLDMHCLAAAAQLLPARIELMFGKKEVHGRGPDR